MAEYFVDNLILKTIDTRYANDVLNFYKLNHEHFLKWEPDVAASFYTLNFHQANLAYETNQIREKRMLRLWIFHKDFPDILIGTISFTSFIKGPVMSTSIGYKMDRFSCNKGYMTKALSKALEIIFTEYHFHRVEALVHPDNAISAHILTKLGFEFESVSKSAVKINNIWTDHHRYVLINPDD